MGDISPGYLFTPSEGRSGLTSIKLNAAGNGATINPSFVSSKPAVSSVTSADQLLLLKADGTYARVPATAVGTGGGGGGGDMYRSVYDTNLNGVVDTCDALPWGSVTGKPATYPPDSTAMLKSVYDTNNDGISDHAALADTAPWTGITGKPSSFTPSPHETTHITGGSDVIPAPTASASGLVPVLPATFAASKFLRGDATFVQPDYSNLTGVPASFTPSAHKATHQSGGSDAIPLDTLAATTDITTLNASTTAHGLLPKLPGTTTTFLNGNGAYTIPTGVTPAAHASTHITGGSDPIPVATASATGLVPLLSGDPTTFLNGNGVFSAVGGSGTVDPGVWTALSLGTGWTAPTQAQFRIQTAGAVKTVFFRGMIQGAWSVIGTTAFTLPSTAFPSMTRSAVLAGAQNTGTASDVASYIVSVSSAGVATIYFLAASSFVWADHSQTQQVYLDGLSFSL